MKVGMRKKGFGPSLNAAIGGGKPAKTQSQGGKNMEFKKERKLQLDANRKVIIDAYEATREQGPKETVAKLIEGIGPEHTAVVIAECLNATSHDGRISDKARAWAARIDCASEEELNFYGIYSITSYIHPAHLDQIATDAIKAL